MTESSKFISIKNLFPKLYQIIPGWIRGNYYCVTASSGVGKTKFTKYAFVQHSYRYCKANSIPLKIVYFALEESTSKFWDTIRLDILSAKHGIKKTYYQMKGYHEGWTKEDDEKLKEIEGIIVDMKKYIVTIDYVSNPTGIAKTCEKILESLGTKIQGEETEDEYGNKNCSYSFKYHDPDQHVLIIVDHVSLITGEKDPGGRFITKHEALTKWSEFVVRHLISKYNAMVVNVHQQEMAAENNEAFKLGKLEPTLEKLGDNKTIGRDYTVVFGLFNPSKHQMMTYGGTDLRTYGKLSRVLNVIKHRDGEMGDSAIMKFLGSQNKFEEI